MMNLKNARRMARPTTGTVPEDAAASAESPSKKSQVLDLLRGTGGVPLTTIVAATGWQAHTARAALTGLRKLGHVIEHNKIDGETRYAISVVTP